MYERATWACPFSLLHAVTAVCKFLISFKQSKIRMISIPFAIDFCTKYSTTSSAYGRYPKIFCPRKSIWSFVFLKPSLNFLRRSHGSSFKNLRHASNVAPPQHSTALYPTLSILSTIGSICSVVILVAISD